MNAYKIILVVMLGWLLTAPAIQAQSVDDGTGHRIVFQLTDNDTRSHKALTNQLKNLTRGWPKADIEVVVHSAGIGYLQKSKSEFAEEIAALCELGVAFMACENTLILQEIPKSDILETAGFVPMGIGAVVLRQEAGWSYIKAGF